MKNLVTRNVVIHNDKATITVSASHNVTITEDQVIINLVGVTTGRMPSTTKPTTTTTTKTKTTTTKRRRGRPRKTIL